MGTAKLNIDLNAVARNWRALDAKTHCETAAVVKADGYGLGSDVVAKRLAAEGARKFFVAAAEEGQKVRQAIGAGPEIFVFSGHMAGDTEFLTQHALVPLLNSVDQMLLHFEALPQHPFGLQLDTGMNRLGMEPTEWAAVKDLAIGQNPELIMSHLACADEPDHQMNARQLQNFRDMTDGLNVPRSLGATGGLLLGADYHFDLCRPGIGLYGGMPFAEATSVVTLDVPVIQCRDLVRGETVGYGNSWSASGPARIATIAAGYADGLIRAIGSGAAKLYADGFAVPVVGRVSMDLITVDISALDTDPTSLQILGPHQTVDDLAKMAGTIGYEILTSLGARYARELA